MRLLCLKRGLRSMKLEPDAILARARELRAKTAGYVLTDEELRKIKDEGCL